MLALNWKGLSFVPAQVRSDFVDKVVKPLRTLASTTIDRGAILKGIFLPGTIGGFVQAAYERHLSAPPPCSTFPTNRAS